MALVTTIGGVALVVVAWCGSNGTGGLDPDGPWKGLALAGLIAVGAHGAGRLIHARRAVSLRRTSLVEQLERAGSHVLASAVTLRTFLVVPGSERYHEEACQLVRGKDARRASAAVLGDLHPCEVCQPVSES
jgi:hypothetical protein